MKKKQEFYPVKQQPKERGIVFAVLYLAILRVKHDRSGRFLKQPKDVAAFLDNISQPGWQLSQVSADWG